MFGIQSLITDGKLFTQGMSGILYAYEPKRGKLLWTYAADDPTTKTYGLTNGTLDPYL